MPPSIDLVGSAGLTMFDRRHHHRRRDRRRRRVRVRRAAEPARCAIRRRVRHHRGRVADNADSALGGGDRGRGPGHADLPRARPGRWDWLDAEAAETRRAGGPQRQPWAATPSPPCGAIARSRRWWAFCSCTRHLSRRPTTPAAGCSWGFYRDDRRLGRYRQLRRELHRRPPAVGQAGHPGGAGRDRSDGHGTGHRGHGQPDRRRGRHLRDLGSQCHREGVPGRLAAGRPARGHARRPSAARSRCCSWPGCWAAR